MYRVKGKKAVIAMTVLFLLWMAAGQDVKQAPSPLGTAAGQSIAGAFAEAVYGQYLPIAAQRYVGAGKNWLFECQMENLVPLYGFARKGLLQLTEYSGTAHEEGEAKNLAARPGQGEAEHNIIYFPEDDSTDEESLQELLQAENEAAMAAAFVPHDKRMQLDPGEFADYETLVRTFYTIDSNTMAGSGQLNAEKLLAEDLSIQKNQDAPQILIYHTHSQEAFADSAEGDESTSIVGVGEHLAEILRTEYGYNVLHHTGRYDVESRDNAYGNALPELEQLLAENPTITVVIDLHRDQMPEENRLVMNLDGRPTARFMFFNGLSRTKKTGDIDYLENKNIGTNLAFSFQMQLKAAEYYPGLTRKIYLKGYRYNMHLCPRSLLVELGAQNNTVEEAMNACGPLAHLLDMVLSGE